MVVIVIRRFIRPDREPEFLATYRSEAPLQNPACKRETLTKVSVATELPPGLCGLALSGARCVTYLNSAEWDSWEAFANQFPLETTFDPEIETAPRERAVLEVVGPNED